MCGLGWSAAQARRPGAGAEEGRAARSGGAAGLVTMSPPNSHGAQLGLAEVGVGCTEVQLRAEGGVLLGEAGGRKGPGNQAGKHIHYFLVGSADTSVG